MFSTDTLIAPVLETRHAAVTANFDRVSVTANFDRRHSQFSSVSVQFSSVQFNGVPRRPDHLRRKRSGRHGAAQLAWLDERGAGMPHHTQCNHCALSALGSLRTQCPVLCHNSALSAQCTRVFKVLCALSAQCTQVCSDLSAQCMHCCRDQGAETAV